MHKSLKNLEQMKTNGASIHQKSIKNQSQNRCRKRDLPKSIKIYPWSVQGPKLSLWVFVEWGVLGLGGPRGGLARAESRIKRNEETRNGKKDLTRRGPTARRIIYIYIYIYIAIFRSSGACARVGCSRRPRQAPQ